MSERVLNYAGALQHLRKRGAELGMKDLAELTLAALQARVRRGSLKPTARRNRKVPLFSEAYLDRWIVGALPEQKEAA
jgi:hypothetical protein